MKWIIHIVCIIGLTGCAHNSYQADQFRYHDDGVAKPRVALVPVIDKSAHSLNWDLSDEFTRAIWDDLSESRALYLTHDFQMINQESLQRLELNPFSDSLDWLREVSSSTEFIVFTEIIDHSLSTAQEESSLFSFGHSQALHLALRVRVIDLRPETPRVILQEIFEDSFKIPYQMGSYGSSKSALSRGAFSLSPMGIAHSHMVKGLSRQVQDYILIAKVN